MVFNEVLFELLLDFLLPFLEVLLEQLIYIQLLKLGFPLLFSNLQDVLPQEPAGLGVLDHVVEFVGRVDGWHKNDLLGEAFEVKDLCCSLRAST